MARGKRSNLEVDRNIVSVLKELGAVSRTTAVCADRIIKYAISKGITEDFPRGGNDGHPWSPRLSVMAGVGTPNAVARHNDVHLFREKKISVGHDLKHRILYCYWYDANSRRTEPIKEYKRQAPKPKDKTAENSAPAKKHTSIRKRNNIGSLMESLKTNILKRKAEVVPRIPEPEVEKKNPQVTPQETKQETKFNSVVEIAVIVEVNAITNAELLKMLDSANAKLDNVTNDHSFINELFDEEWLKTHSTKLSKHLKVTR